MRQSSKRTRSLLHDRDVVESLLVALATCLLSLGTAYLLCLLRVLWVGLRTRPADRPLACVLVCGHRLEAGFPSRDYRCRLEESARLLRRWPSTRVLLLGGGSPSEAGIGRRWLTQVHGIPGGRIETEEESTDTLENLRRARDLAGHGCETHPLGLLSSRFHLARLAAMSDSLGIRAKLVPAGGWMTGLLARPGAVLGEAGFLCWFASGRIWARFMGRRRMLDRIR